MSSIMVFIGDAMADVTPRYDPNFRRPSLSRERNRPENYSVSQEITPLECIRTTPSRRSPDRLQDQFPTQSKSRQKRVTFKNVTTEVVVPTQDSTINETSSPIDDGLQPPTSSRGASVPSTTSEKASESSASHDTCWRLS